MCNAFVTGSLIAFIGGSLVAWIWIAFINDDSCSTVDAVKNLHYENLDYRSGRLYWDSPDDNSIEKYIIKVNSPLNSHVDFFETTNLEYTLQNLEPCLNYSFNVDAIPKKRSEKYKSVFGVGQTPFIQSYEPDHFIYNAEAKMVEWTSIYDQCISGFRLMFFHSGICIKDIKLGADAKNYNVSDISSCSSYVITLETFGKNILNSNLIKYEIKPDSDISSLILVQNLRYSKESSGIILLEWDFSPSNDCIYDVVVSIPEYTDVPFSIVPKQRTSIRLTGLKPCMEYRVTIVARNVHKELIGKPASTSIRSSSLENEVANITFSETNDLLVVKWNAAIVTTDCATLYSLEICPLDVIANCRSFKPEAQPENSSMAVSIPDIVACSTYKISVSVVTVKLHHAFYSEIYQSNAKAFEAPVLKEIVNLTSTTVSIEWGFRDVVKNRCICTTITLECTTDGNSFMSYEYVANRTEAGGAFARTSVVNLLPYTNYTCYATFHQRNSSSEKSKLVQFTTLEDVPSAVSNLTADTRSDGCIIKWKPPEISNGVLSSYRVQVKHIRPLYVAPTWCRSKERLPFKWTLRGSDYTFEVKTLQPFEEYEVSVAAATSVGPGAAKQTLIHTAPTSPGEVNQLQYSIISPHVYVVTWKQPCRCNGLLSLFKVMVTGTRDKHPDDTFSYSVLPNVTYPDTVYSVRLPKLRPVYNYAIRVSAKVDKVKDFGNTILLELSTPSSLPPEPYYDQVHGKVNPEPVSGRNGTQFKVTLQKDMFEDTGGEILYYAIVVGRDISFNNKVEQGALNVRKEWPQMNNYKEASEYDFIFPYQVTPPYWNPFQGISEKEKVDFVIGEDAVCETPSNGFCNGPLKPDTRYSLKIRAFTEAGYQDSPPLKFSTGSEIEYAAHANHLMVVCVLVFLGFVVCGLYYVKTRHIPILVEVSRRMNGKRKLSVVPTKSIPVKSFAEYYAKLQASVHTLKTEFNELNEISAKYTLTDNVAKRYDNYRKNRYVNIVPYDETRVKINTDRGDYINASFIEGFKENKAKYIACQGPLVETFADFWTMIIQYDINIVVMLCQIVENKRTVCEKYFPDVNETLTFNGINVECTIMTSNSLFEERKIVVTNDDKELTVSHIKFLEWPDFGIPSDPEILVDFCNAVRKRGADKSIVVHCSAGVGRTGTFIACDILLQQLSTNKYINIFNTVLDLRKQRPGMVQSIAQYSYLYECVYNGIKRRTQSRNTKVNNIV